jgi:hypothetical protein
LQKQLSEKDREKAKHERSLKVMRDFVMRLQNHFTLPASVENKDLFYEDYIDALGGYSEKVLMEAAKRVVSGRQFATFPLLSECIDICDAIHKRLHPEPAPRTWIKSYPEWEEACVMAANRMMISDMGRAASDEGWQVALWDFFRLQGRYPNEQEMRAIRAKSLAEWVLTNEYDQTRGIYFKIVAPLYKVFRRRKELLKKIAHGELPPTTTMMEFKD